MAKFDKHCKNTPVDIPQFQHPICATKNLAGCKVVLMCEARRTSHKATRVHAECPGPVVSEADLIRPAIPADVEPPNLARANSGRLTWVDTS